MFSTVLSATLRGLSVEFVHVEVDISNGLPIFHMVGSLSTEIKEASERIKTAVRNSGFVLPAKRIVVNLSPANIRKKGAMFDLPIAIAILASLGEIDSEYLRDMLVIGELSLDGQVKSVPGVLSMVNEAKKRGCNTCIVPRANQKEAELTEGIRIIGVESLCEVCQFLVCGVEAAKGQSYETQADAEHTKKYRVDFNEIHGQQLAKRAAEIAVAGKHNLLMIGPPGGGKSMIAKRIPTILPGLTKEESMELTKIYSIIGELDEDNPLILERPFREVHQSVTKTALIGGGNYPKPGEISLAHLGVLFLDEIAEFSRPVLEQLRQPLEEHQIRLLREKGEYLFPADFLLVAAMNPCPCGNYPDLNRCICTSAQIQNYLGKLSQPFLDRIELCVDVERVRYEELQSKRKEESSKEIRKRVCAARDRQAKRYQGMHITVNAELDTKGVERYCQLTRGDEKMMQQAFEKLNLTARSYYKVLKVARTIADLAGEEQITSMHLSEALCFRAMDKKQEERSNYEV